MQTQMELSFDHTLRGRARGRRQRRMTRAHWWFAQMRRVVDGALDWNPAPTAPPEQMDLVGTPERYAA